MTELKVLILFLGMMAVTFIPRAIPAIFISKMHFSAKFEKFLTLIPYTAMAALIFSGVFTCDKDNLSIGIVGAMVAGLLAFYKLNLIICVIGSIFVVFLMYCFI